MRSLEELNLSNVRARPNEKKLRELEKFLGFDLPMEYREFLEGANGGCPEVDTFEDENGEEWAINNFFFVGPDINSTESVVWNHLHRWPGITPDYLPIARDGGGNLFLLNISTTHSGEVWIWVHDEPDSPLRKLSYQFEEFVDRLHLNPEYI